MTPEELAEAGVRAIALVLVDNGGIARMKCVSIDRLERAATRGIGWGEHLGSVALGRLVCPRTELYSPTGELRLRADLAAGGRSEARPAGAWPPVDHHLQSGEPWPGCQRWFLRRMSRTRPRRSIELKAAWELEWTVGADGPQGFHALHPGPGYGAATFDQTGALSSSSCSTRWPGPA